MSTRYNREEPNPVDYKKGYVDGQSRQSSANLTLGVLLGAVLVIVAGLGVWVFLRQDTATTEQQPNIINIPESNSEPPEINIEIPEVSPPEVTIPEINLPEGTQTSPQEDSPADSAPSGSNN
ncbi:hypothetical protein GS597_06160 [Synechococcales cyanobacterium C]|uniref:Uncharacterized protein n=1 Tax=Petrachloros mirabilis ULC683 TaxID=2781853 RepID=A0A8K1ZVR6_9CYAN|nr:hypothetical protein [Petrachloros mirabilis]NCJ06105.1 hypothetical protein [Petrachloros mirabilis ULC683]